jgi:type IV pilus assembly protein PilE
MQKPNTPIPLEKKAEEKAKGWTLIELLITLTLIGILSSLAYPSYTQFIVKMRRLEAQTALFDLASKLEQAYLTYQTYRHEDILSSQSMIAHGAYTIKYLDITPHSYRITAIPTPFQAKHDHTCGDLTLDSQGRKSHSGSATLYTCWP